MVPSETLVRKYYTKVREAVDSRLFDVVGHFDIIRQFVPANQDSISLASDIIDSTFEKMVANKVHLEINSWRRTDQEPFPCKELIRRYLAKKGELFSLGSDAHSWQKLATGIEQSRNLLASLHPRNVRILFDH
jgi:histidinol-phosphatase (PHP family)